MRILLIVNTVPGLFWIAMHLLSVGGTIVRLSGSASERRASFLEEQSTGHQTQTESRLAFLIPFSSKATQ